MYVGTFETLDELYHMNSLCDLIENDQVTEVCKKVSHTQFC